MGILPCLRVSSGTQSATSVASRRSERRAIQVGLARAIIGRYVNDWTVEIRDITPLVHSLRRLLDEGRSADAQRRLPHERQYPVNEAMARRLGMDDP